MIQVYPSMSTYESYDTYVTMSVQAIGKHVRVGLPQMLEDSMLIQWLWGPSHILQGAQGILATRWGHEVMFVGV